MRHQGSQPMEVMPRSLFQTIRCMFFVSLTYLFPNYSLEYLSLSKY